MHGKRLQLPAQQWGQPPHGMCQHCPLQRPHVLISCRQLYGGDQTNGFQLSWVALAGITQNPVCPATGPIHRSPVSLCIRAPAQVELSHPLTQSSMSLQPSNVFLPPNNAWSSTQAQLCHIKSWEAMDHTAGDMASPAAGSSRFSLASPTPAATTS